MNKLKLFPTALWKGRNKKHFSSCGYTSFTFWDSSVVKHGGFDVPENIEDCDAVCLFVTYLGGNFVFDSETADKIAALKKPIVVFDYSEYGGHVTTHLSEYNLYGYDIQCSGLLAGDYGKTHEFLLANQDLIKCYFKRELSSNNDLYKVPFRVYPLEFVATCYDDDSPLDTVEQYRARPCIVNFIWGYSNVSRPLFQGAMMLRIRDWCCEFALSYKQVVEHLKTPEKRFITTINHAYYERIKHDELMELNKHAMMTIDLYGAGLKCFRNVESAANCLSAKQDPSKLRWTYPWVDGVNCIALPTLPGSNVIDATKAVDILLTSWTKERESWYNMYLASAKMNSLYNPKNYVPNHIIKHISSNL